MPNPNHSDLKPIGQPESFKPDRRWLAGSYLIQFDSGQRIIKRSPVSLTASGGTMYFRVASPPARATNRRRLPIGGWQLILKGVVAAAVLIMVYPWLPEFQYRLHPPAPVTAAALATASADQAVSGNQLIIPKIGVNAAINEGSNLKVLDSNDGVWHQTGGINQNFVLAGHRFRYLPPNTTTLYNLDKLVPGDLAAVDWLGKRTVYRITELKTVDAKEVSVLNSSASPRLTIYSCSDEAEVRRVVAIGEPLPAP